ncbi:MAG TPA: hypothetical protein VLI69_03825 [Gammaproteobacteria bacterium]|nr:hypothetical protein [Gammaproteobacteria bacterium]
MALRQPLLRGSINGDDFAIVVDSEHQTEEKKPNANRSPIMVLPEAILQVVLDYCETISGYSLLREWSDQWSAFFLKDYCKNDKELLRQFAETILKEHYDMPALLEAIDENVKIQSGIEARKLAVWNKGRWIGAGLVYTGLTATFCYWGAVNFPEQLKTVEALRRTCNVLYRQMQQKSTDIFDMNFCVIKTDLPWQPSCIGPWSCHTYDPYMLDCGNYPFYRGNYIDVWRRDLQDIEVKHDSCSSPLDGRLARSAEALLTEYTNTFVQAYSIRDSSWAILGSGSAGIGVGACLFMLIALCQKYHGNRKVYEIIQGEANAMKRPFTSSLGITNKTSDPDGVRVLLDCIAPADERKPVQKVREQVDALRSVEAQPQEVRPQAYCKFFRPKIPDSTAALGAASRKEAGRRGCVLL